MYGHTVAALLGTTYQQGTWFEVWNFQRGLTSTLFLLLSGFAFSIATMRHWPSYTKPSPAFWRRIRRFAFFIVIGYALHFPVPHLADIASTDEARWRSFLAVDVLQLIGVTFICVQLLTLVLQGRRAFMVVSLMLAVVIVAVAPASWTFAWQEHTIPALAAYLTPTTGSLFPLVPWSASVFIGAAAGGLYARWGAAHLSRFATWMLLVPGVLLVVFNLAGGRLPAALEAGEFGWLPMAVLMRTAACLIGLGALAHASRYVTNLPHAFGAVAQESLLIYVVHLCIVYGSIWNPGLYQFYGGSLTPLATFLVVVGLIAAMTLLAWQWNVLKHHRPRTARWITLGTAGLLVLILL